jgi:hypothetical protein
MTRNLAYVSLSDIGQEDAMHDATPETLRLKPFLESQPFVSEVGHAGDVVRFLHRGRPFFAKLEANDLVRLGTRQGAVVRMIDDAGMRIGHPELGDWFGRALDRPLRFAVTVSPGSDVFFADGVQDAGETIRSLAHDACGGEIRKAGEGVRRAFVCMRCALRVSVPPDVRTFADLRRHFSRFDP